MKNKRLIYKIVFFSSWAVVLTGITMLLIAANKKTKSGVCNGINVEIKGEKENAFVEEKEILSSIEKFSKGQLINRDISKIALQPLEKMLEANPWIADAELYFDSKNNLNVLVSERIPVARVFTTAGNSYYIDNTGNQMPLLQDKSLRLQVVTGFTSARKWAVKDSAMFSDVYKVVHFISAHPFWNAQVGQIDVTSNGFELIPTIGDHIIKVGSADEIESKLNRAFIFYQQVMSKTGFNKYSTIDVQYKDQVIAVKRGSFSKVDSIQLKKNIQELLQRKQEEQEREEMVFKNASESNESIENIKSLQSITVPVKTKPDPIVKNPTPQKTNQKSVTPQKPKTTTKRTPKAVMIKKEEQLNEY